MRRNFPSTKVFLIGGLILLIFFLVSLFREVISSYKINGRISEMASQVKALESKNGNLMGSIGEWQSGAKLEKELRLKLGLKKPNEKAILIVDNSSVLNTSPSTANEADTMSNNSLMVKSLKDAKLSNPAKWWRYFFKKNN